ncbi:MAG: glycosyltransferase family 2 protein [Candidatus Omnitrophica bacterium]|jgi:glycosyltransferase involved in cell wall biosynthesis|nr:glycosyltransferase family 2 protein [Candidatus Omnitrophota bacterium]
MKTAVIIPAHNEADGIRSLLQEINKQDLDVIVIDDGSTDDTFKLAIDLGAIVLRNDQNLGKGAALVKGFDYAVKKGYEAVLTMDGDGQHRPLDIPAFLSAARSPAYGIIIGNRMTKTENMPRIRILTNKFMSWVISIITKQRIPDSQCGFRLIKSPVLQKIKLQTRNFEIESEMLIEASRAGFAIASVPVQTVYANERSHIHPVRDTLRFFKYLHERTKKIKPLRKRR